MSTNGSSFTDIGANPSAEEGGASDLEKKTEQVIDICDAFRLKETEPKHLDKKDYKARLKGNLRAPSGLTISLALTLMPFACQIT